MKNVVITLLVLAAGYLAYLQFGDSEQANNNFNNEKFKQRQTTTKVEKRDINFSVTVAGELSPAEKVSVRPEVNGKIAKKGDLLFRLDDKDIRIEIDSRKKQIDSANLQLAQSQKEFERASQLYQDDLVSKEV